MFKKIKITKKSESWMLILYPQKIVLNNTNTQKMGNSKLKLACSWILSYTRS